MSVSSSLNRNDLSLESPPDSIAIQLTTRCNLRCKMCKFWELKGKDLPYENVLSILNEAYELGARRFDPYGTELFMRKDMPDILAYADGIGFREIYLVSNGVLLNRPELIDKLANIKSLVIIVSIDGPQAIHDQLRGDGVFDQAVSNLRELGKRGIKRSIASIIMRPTIDNLQEIVDLAFDLKIEVISLQPFCPDMAKPDGEHETFKFKPDEKKMVEKKLKDLLKYARKKNVTIYTGNLLKYVAPYLAEGVIPFPKRGCRVPLKTLVIDIEGNSYPCFTTLKSMGNIREMNLTSIWHSDVRKKFAVSALDRKCPGCLRACSDVESYNDNGIISSVKDWRFVRYMKRRFHL